MVTSCLQWSIQEPIIFPSGPTAEPKHTKSCTISFYSFLYYRINSSLTLMVLCKCWIMFLRLQRHLLLQLFWLWPKISHYRINLFFRLFCLKMRHKYVDPQPTYLVPESRWTPFMVQASSLPQQWFQICSYRWTQTIIALFLRDPYFIMFLLFNPPGRDFKSDLILTVMNFIVCYLHFLIFKHFFNSVWRIPPWCF